jgi:hypothetical protein
MSERSLYIIGNGFDIFHGVKSKYSDFRDFVKINDKNLFETLEEYFEPELLWSEFEETLAQIDTEKIIEDAEYYLYPYNADDWSESYNHSYQEEIKKIVESVTILLKSIFIKWILSLKVDCSKRLNLPLNSTYLNFNYSATLESIYRISNENIEYIHNKAENEKSNLILGHSRKNPQGGNENYSDDEDFRIKEGIVLIEKYFLDTYKNTEDVIAKKEEFFCKLDSIEKVYVFGHSISKVDIKYFEKVYNTIKFDAKWTVSYHHKDEMPKLKEALESIGLNSNNIKLIELNDITI